MVLLACAQPVAGTQESLVQGLLSLQSTGVLVQPPFPLQRSVVQALWSSQGFGPGMQTPLAH